MAFCRNVVRASCVRVLAAVLDRRSATPADATALPGGLRGVRAAGGAWCAKPTASAARQLLGQLLQAFFRDFLGGSEFLGEDRDFKFFQ